MRLLGFELRRTKTETKAAPNQALVTDVSALSRGWTRILESVSGAWQRNVVVDSQTVLTYAAVYSCVSLIASDVGKLRIKLDQEQPDAPGIWNETTNSAYTPVLRKPNHYQTRIQFLEQWMISKLIHGNTYVLKERDQRNVVTALYVLDPQRVKPLVAPGGDVYYALQPDLLSGLQTAIVAPAREIIHDVMVPLYHPLCGVSPISACGLAAVQGLSIQNNSTKLFRRGAQPPAILTVLSPGALDPEEVKKVQDDWDAHFGGEDNAGRIAVLGGDMKYQALSMNSVDMQLIDQLKWTAAEVCTAFKVPAHMIGVGPAPTYNNIEALNQQYYSQCLQTLIENIEILLDEGLGLADDLGTELDLDGLLRMDSASRVAAAKESANGGGMTFNEVRMRYHGLGPVPGGDVVLAQQQNFSLEALAKRDARADPFATNPAPADVTPAPAEPNVGKHVADLLRKELQLSVAA